MVVVEAAALLLPPLPNTMGPISLRPLPLAASREARKLPLPPLAAVVEVVVAGAGAATATVVHFCWQTFSATVFLMVVHTLVVTGTFLQALVVTGVQTSLQTSTHSTSGVGAGAAAAAAPLLPPLPMLMMGRLMPLLTAAARRQGGWG